MSAEPPRTVEEFFAAVPLGLDVHRWCADRLQGCVGVTQRVSRSQVKFARRRGFAYLWLPGRWLAHPQAEVVLSLALPEQVPSPRWKEVVQPAPTTWMHHLEVRSLADLDDEVAGWLHRAWFAAA